MVSKILIIALIVGTARAATWRGPLPEKPAEFAHKEGCYIRQINDVIPFGETITPLGICARITCGTSMISGATCGKVMTTDPKCRVTKSDLTKPYPRCCPRVECDVDNNLF